MRFFSIAVISFLLGSAATAPNPPPAAAAKGILRNIAANSPTARTKDRLRQVHFDEKPRIIPPKPLYLLVHFPYDTKDSYLPVIAEKMKEANLGGEYEEWDKKLNPVKNGLLNPYKTAKLVVPFLMSVVYWSWLRAHANDPVPVGPIELFNEQIPLSGSKDFLEDKDNKDDKYDKYNNDDNDNTYNAVASQGGPYFSILFRRDAPVKALQDLEALMKEDHSSLGGDPKLDKEFEFGRDGKTKSAKLFLSDQYMAHYQYWLNLQIDHTQFSIVKVLRY